MSNSKAILQTEIPGQNPVRGKVRDIYDLGDNLLIVATDRISAFDWVLPIDLDTALEQQERLTRLVDAGQLVVKTATLEEGIEDWSSVEFRRAQSAHSGTILASADGLSLSRATPMPSS